MQPTKEPIRADGVVLLKNDNLICHWEFQTNPDKYMAYRMLDYYFRLLGLYPLALPIKARSFQLF
jgi:hypothetical protein